MYKLISTLTIAYLSIVTLSAQTKYWDTNREPSSKFAATYYSKDEVKEDRIERRFYLKRTRKLIFCELLALAPPHENIGIMHFHKNGQVAVEILDAQLAEGKGRRVYHWNKDGSPAGSEIHSIDSSGLDVFNIEYPDGQIKYKIRTQIEPKNQIDPYQIIKEGWYANGQKWFDVKGVAGQIDEINAYDTLGQAIDLSELAEEKISWKDDPELQNRDQIDRKIGYPQLARHEGIEGKVIFRILVSPQGKVLYYELIESPGDILSYAVAEYLWDFEFSPAKAEDGSSVYAWTEYLAHFRLLN